MNFNWNEDKNEQLKKERGISFEEIEKEIALGGLLDDIEHPNQEKYNHQRILVVQIKDYIYYVPYVVEENSNIFLKTIYKNRKARKYYLFT